MNTDDQLANRTKVFKRTTVSEHFLTANHSASDMLLIPIQKLYSARDSIRKARETFLITKANTLELNRLIFNFAIMQPFYYF